MFVQQPDGFGTGKLQTGLARSSKLVIVSRPHIPMAIYLASGKMSNRIPHKVESFRPPNLRGYAMLPRLLNYRYLVIALGPLCLTGLNTYYAERARAAIIIIADFLIQGSRVATAGSAAIPPV